MSVVKSASRKIFIARPPQNQFISTRKTCMEKYKFLGQIPSEYSVVSAIYIRSLKSAFNEPLTNTKKKPMQILQKPEIDEIHMRHV